MCVVNGRAAAPPWIGWSIGVSTSRYSCAFMWSRIARTVSLRSRAIRRASSLTIRSTYRWRTRASGSVSPACFSGSGRRHFEVSANRSAMIDSSPRLDVMTSPSTPTWSPRSMSRFHDSRASSPTLARDSMIWMSPLPSRIVAKQSLPVLRASMTRPVTPTLVPVDVPGSRPGWSARTCPIVGVRGKPSGYGSTPLSRSRSTLSRRMRNSSGRSSCDSFTNGTATAPSHALANAFTCHRLGSVITRGAAVLLRRDADVALVDQAQADQSQPRLVRVDGAGLVQDEGGQAAGGHHGDLFRVVGQLLRHPLDHAVHLAGEAEDDARLQRLDRALADDVAGPYELDLVQLRTALGQRVDRDLDARGDRAADVLPLGRDRVERRRGAEVDHDRRAAVDVRGGQRVDDAVGPDLFGVVHAYGDAGLDARLHDHRGDVAVVAAARLAHLVQHRGDGGAERDPADVGLGQQRALLHEALEHDRDLVRGASSVGVDPPVYDDLFALEQAEHRMGVTDVDREQHQVPADSGQGRCRARARSASALPPQGSRLRSRPHLGPCPG